jgi:para-nitrobenzyl esterase
VAKLLGILLPEQSEDCLYVNIWTPSLDGRRPVMVWLPGGAWLIGSGAQTVYDGTRLAARGDVVVVTVSYRLGALGFLRGEDLCGDAFHTGGNEGVLDCVAALRWVREEIANFGGDPERVTLFGESAGAVNTAALLSSPLAKGLFQRAIVQSGPLTLLQTPANATAQCQRLLDAAGVEAQRAGEGLRAMEWPALLEAQNRSVPPGALASYGPNADGEVIPSDPHAALAAGTGAGVPLLVGSNLDEMRLYGLLDPGAEGMSLETLLARLGPVAALRGRDAVAVVDAYREARQDRGEGVTPTDLWFAVMTDLTFRLGTIRLAEAQAEQAPVYSYLFTKPSPAYEGRIRAAHATDLPYVFGNLEDPLMGLVADPSPAGWALSNAMQDAWLAFARQGDPSTPANPWPRFETGRRRTMVIDEEWQLAEAPYEQERAYWS